MPKLINHTERKQAIAHAVWAILSREGVRNVSVRTVAAEAKISTGSLRHVFPSHEEMMLYSLDYLGKKFISSLSQKSFQGPLLAQFEDMFTYLTPLSEEGNLFATVAAGFLSELTKIPEASKILQNHQTDFRYAYGFLLTQLRAQGYLKEEVVIEEEIDQLLALLWGISCIHLQTDGALDRQELVDPMTQHFNAILTSP
ncbi:MAG: TetR family transcriptional regulator [Rothia sp. (in: high G+C Gram-positive bacteria)]|nr:TetR family transcriptional regulator [Rothia sp. (in: high G+C Gram-positive bacteria)]